MGQMEKVSAPLYFQGVGRIGRIYILKVCMGVYIYSIRARVERLQSCEKFYPFFEYPSYPRH